MSRSVLSVAVAVAAVFLTGSGAYAQVKSAPPPPPPPKAAPAAAKSAPAAQAKGAAAAKTFKDSRDGKTYKTVKVGSQTWFAENLNYAEKGSVCYENNDANCAKYGRLYDWATALKACPAGSHLPSDDEWTALENAVGGRSTAGIKLKSTTGWKYEYGREDGSGTNDFGWSALSGGLGEEHGVFDAAGYDAYWWSATEIDANKTWIRYMNSEKDDVVRSDLGKSNKASVRCVEDR